MTQMALTLNGGSTRPPPIDWHRHPGWHGGTCGARFDLLIDGEPDGTFVQHCDHPTALRPYYVGLKNGHTLERKFRLLADAKNAALACAHGAKLIFEPDQCRAERGNIVTDWHLTQEDAYRAFCIRAGLTPGGAS